LVANIAVSILRNRLLGYRQITTSIKRYGRLRPYELQGGENLKGTSEESKDTYEGPQQLIDETKIRRIFEEIEEIRDDMVARNADYLLTEKLMISNKVSRQTYLIFSLAEQYLKNAEFQLGRYHAAVAERRTVMNRVSGKGRMLHILHLN